METPLFNTSSCEANTADKLVQNCPDWVKITEIPHPALVPGFIGRRECLPDGSIDPNTVSVSAQMSLLGSSMLSPALSTVISNVPSGLMCESIHKRNLKEARPAEIEVSTLKNGFSPLNLPPLHYKRTGDPITIPSASSAGSASQTAAELSALNILNGGVRGKAYLTSLDTFVTGCPALKGSQVENLLKTKLERTESACGFKIFNMKHNPSEELTLDITITPAAGDTLSLLEENDKLFKLLNSLESSSESRQLLLARLKDNLSELIKTCPQEVREERFKGVQVDLL